MSRRRTIAPPAPAATTYRDGVQLERCLGCLQLVEECFCKRPYWCTWCWTVDGSQFLHTDTRCCAACLKKGLTARFRA